MPYTPTGLTSVRTTIDNTAGAGTADTVAAFVGAVYATDAATILNNFHQICVRLLALEVALKAKGVVKT